MQLRLQVSQIPQSDGLVCRPGGQNRLGSRVERDRIDGITVLTLGRSSGTSGVSSTNIQDLKSDVVGDGADKGRVEGMVLNVINDRGMVGVGAARAKRFVALGVCSKVPTLGQYPNQLEAVSSALTKVELSCPRFQ